MRPREAEVQNDMLAPMARATALLLLLASSASAFAAARIYDVLYDVNVVPARHGAEVTLSLKQSRDYVREFTFSIDPSRQEGFAGDGTVKVDGERVHWLPPERG